MPIEPIYTPVIKLMAAEEVRTANNITIERNMG